MRAILLQNDILIAEAWSQNDGFAFHSAIPIVIITKVKI